MGRIPLRPLLSVLIAIGISSPAHGQVPFAACLDRSNHPIAGIVDNTLAFAAAATMRDGQRVILWNQHSLAGSSSTFQLFLYLHECAHHSLNHIYKGESRSVEQQADCWAVQLMVDGGMVNGSQLAELTRELKSSRGDINHLGGAELLRALEACLKVRRDPEAWGVALAGLTGAAPGAFEDVRGPQIPDAPPGTSETTLGAPGTYDCELLSPPAVRCMVFTARKQKAAEKRFQELRNIIDHWLSTDWTATEPVSLPSHLAREYIAQESGSGTLLVLGLTHDARIYFLVKQRNESGTATPSAN